MRHIRDIDALQAEIKEVIDLIDVAMDHVKSDSLARNVDAYKLKTPEDRWVMHELLLGKVKGYHAIALLETLKY